MSPEGRRWSRGGAARASGQILFQLRHRRGGQEQRAGGRGCRGKLPTGMTMVALAGTASSTAAARRSGSDPRKRHQRIARGSRRGSSPRHLPSAAPERCQGARRSDESRLAVQGMCGICAPTEADGTQQVPSGSSLTLRTYWLAWAGVGYGWERETTTNPKVHRGREEIVEAVFSIRARAAMSAASLRPRLPHSGHFLLDTLGPGR